MGLEDGGMHRCMVEVQNWNLELGSDEASSGFKEE